MLYAKGCQEARRLLEKVMRETVYCVIKWDFQRQYSIIADAFTTSTIERLNFIVLAHPEDSGLFACHLPHSNSSETVRLCDDGIVSKI